MPFIKMSSGSIFYVYGKSRQSMTHKNVHCSASRSGVPQTGALDADFEILKAHFSEAETIQITVAIGVINVWNRLAVSFRFQHPVEAKRVVA